MGLGRKPSPPGHKVLYSAVEKISQGNPELSEFPRDRRGKRTRRHPGEIGPEAGGSGPGGAA